MNKRIILVGPTCGGKTFLRKRLENRGFKCDVSYTSREPREGEKNGVHYHFIGKKQFEILIKGGFFYEWVEYNGNYYGTGLKEWNELPLFIMETDGIKHIKEEDRKTCFVIYINPEEHIRVARMRLERRWNYEEIQKRLETDNKKFENFKDYDMIITDPNF
jgi:guanylate kinase